MSLRETVRYIPGIPRAASYEIGGNEVDIDTMLAETEAGRFAEIEAGLAGADV